MPASLDKDPQPAPGTGEDMGDLGAAHGALTGLYGDLAIRYNSLRSWAKCLVIEHNTGKTPEGCGK